MSREVFESPPKDSAIYPHVRRTSAASVAVPETMSILSMSTLLAKSAPDLVEIIVMHAAAAQSNAVSAAKGIIALIKVTGSEEVARTTLKKAKVSDCTVKNAMQLVWAYDAVVTPGHASEAWFDQLLYAHAVEVRRAIAKVGVAKLCDAKLFAKSAKANMIEFELIGDTGMLRDERIAATQAKVDADLIAAKTKKDAEEAAFFAAAKKQAEAPGVAAGAGATPPAATEDIPAPVAKETKAPAKEKPAAGAVAALETSAPGKAKKGVLAEFETLLKSAETFVGLVIPGADDVTVEAMKARVAGLMVVMNAAVEARAAVAKAA